MKLALLGATGQIRRRLGRRAVARRHELIGVVRDDIGPAVALQPGERSRRCGIDGDRLLAVARLDEVDRPRQVRQRIAVAC